MSAYGVTEYSTPRTSPNHHRPGMVDHGH